MNRAREKGHVTACQLLSGGRWSLLLLASLLFVGLAGLPGLAQQPAQANPDLANRVREALLLLARDEAQRLAEFYQKALTEQVGRQARDHLQRLVEAEERKAQQRLDQADRQLGEVGRTAEQLERELAGFEGRLLELQRRVDAARDKKDDKGAKQFAQQVKYRHGEIQSVAQRVQNVGPALGRAPAPLAADWPGLTAGLKAGAERHAGAAGKQAHQAATAVRDGKAGDALTAIKTSREQLRQLAESTRRLHAAFEVHRAAEAADRLARTTAAAADALQRFAATGAALKGKGPDTPADALVKMRQAAHWCGNAVNEARQFGEALRRAVAALKDTPKALGKAVPHAAGAIGDLKKGNEELGRGEAAKAAAKVTAAAAHLKDVAGELHAAHGRLGLEGGEDAAALARAADVLLTGEMPAQIEEQLARTHGAVLPGLLQKARLAAEKVLPPGEVRVTALKQLEAVLGRELLARVKAGERFAEGAGGPPAAKDAKPSPRAAALVAAAAKTLRATLDRQLAALAVAGARQVTFPLPGLGALPPLPPPKVPRKSVGVPPVPDGAITIDGDLSDWKGRAVLELEGLFRGTRKPAVSPAVQRAWVGYNARGLFVAVEVIDTTGALENHYPLPEFWLNDCVEVYVDTLNSGSAERGEPHTHQFFAFPFGHKDDPQSGGYEAYMLREGGRLTSRIVRHAADVIRRAAKKTERGWTMELFIPKELLRHGDLTPGRVVGFNLQIDSGSDLYFFWNGAGAVRTSMRPDTWGELRLLAAPAKGGKGGQNP